MFIRSDYILQTLLNLIYKIRLLSLLRVYSRVRDEELRQQIEKSKKIQQIRKRML